jgi:RimJ/RimL family protein N-acetyltransferase
MEAEPTATDPIGPAPALPVPVLTDGHVSLRRWRLADAETARAMCADEESQRWTQRLPTPYTIDDAIEWIDVLAPAGWASGRKYAFAVADPPGDRAIGSISLRDHGAGVGSVGFLTAPTDRGRGVATAALRLVTRWAFEARGLDRVEWQAKVGNAASRKVAERAGFRVEGIRRAGLLDRSGRVDAWFGALLRGEPTEGVPTEPLWPPRLVTARLVLRPVGAADVGAITDACRDPTTVHWLPNLPSPYTAADAAAFVAGQVAAPWEGRFDLAVTERRSGRLLGMIGLFGYRRRLAQAEIGYWIAPGERRNGYATEALRALTAWALFEQAMHRVTVTVDAGNLASRAVAAAAGFTDEGAARDGALDRSGSWRTIVTYARVAG